MNITYDPVKNARNIRERGLSFDMVVALDWSKAIVREDTRFDYPEPRFQAFVYGAGLPYVVVYCIEGEARRIISFRRAHDKERKFYE